MMSLYLYCNFIIFSAFYVVESGNISSLLHSTDQIKRRERTEGRERLYTSAWNLICSDRKMYGEVMMMKQEMKLLGSGLGNLIIMNS